LNAWSGSLHQVSRGWTLTTRYPKDILVPATAVPTFVTFIHGRRSTAREPRRRPLFTPPCDTLISHRKPV